MHKIRNA